MSTRRFECLVERLINGNFACLVHESSYHGRLNRYESDLDISRVIFINYSCRLQIENDCRFIIATMKISTKISFPKIKERSEEPWVEMLVCLKL